MRARQLDKTVPVPLYFQLKKMILGDIKEGVYPVHGLIPTESEFSITHNISRNTVRQAITELVQEGWLYRIKSKGTFVAHLKLKQDFTKRIESFDVHMNRIGCIPSTRVLMMQIIPLPDDISQTISEPAGTEFLYIHRQRFADDTPIVTVETYLPYDKCRFLLNHNFEKESLYSVMARNEATKIFRTSRVLEAVAATPADVALLQMKEGEPVQFFMTFGYNRADELIEFSLARYRGDRSKFEVNFLADYE